MQGECRPAQGKRARGEVWSEGEKGLVRSGKPGPGDDAEADMRMVRSASGRFGAQVLGDEWRVEVDYAGPDQGYARTTTSRSNNGEKTSSIYMLEEQQQPEKRCWRKLLFRGNTGLEDQRTSAESSCLTFGQARQTRQARQAGQPASQAVYVLKGKRRIGGRWGALNLVRKQPRAAEQQSTDGQPRQTWAAGTGTQGRTRAENGAEWLE
jgi:hypothetical protein